MGIENGHNIIFKAESVVSSELNSMLHLIKSTSQLSNQSNAHSKKLRIDCDISNIIHQLANRRCRVYSIELVRDVAKFLKKLAAPISYSVRCSISNLINLHIYYSIQNTSIFVNQYIYIYITLIKHYYTLNNNNC